MGRLHPAELLAPHLLLPVQLAPLPVPAELQPRPERRAVTGRRGEPQYPGARSSSRVLGAVAAAVVDDDDRIAATEQRRYPVRRARFVVLKHQQPHQLRHRPVGQLGLRRGRGDRRRRESDLG